MSSETAVPAGDAPNAIGLAEAWKLDRRENLAEVEAACDAALAENPKDQSALHLKGLAALEAGKPGRAERLLTNALRIDDRQLDTARDLARARHRQGKLAPAEAVLLEVLARRQDDAEAFDMLAEIQLQKGKVAEAEILCGKAASLEPDNIRYVSHLAKAALHHGNWSGAFSAAKIWYDDDPQDPSACRTVGQALLSMGNVAESFGMLREALRLDPENHGTREDIVRALSLSGLHESAEDFLVEALEDYPDSVQLWNRLGHLRVERKHFEEALEAFQRGMALNKRHPGIWSGLGQVYTHLLRGDEAKKTLEQATKLFPRNPQARINLAVDANFRGDPKEAERHIEAALALDPNHTRGLFHYVSLKKADTEPEILDRLERIKNDPMLKPEDKHRALYTSGDVKHALKDYAGAWEDYLLGGRIKYSLLDYSIHTNLAAQKRIREQVTAPFIARCMEEGGCEDDRPVFIVGTPRSGTTLTEQILAAHPDVAGVGERPDLELAFRVRDAKTVEEQGRHYAEKVASLAPEGARRIVDKMPGNFALAGYIPCVLPNAKIIHCRRHPLDALLSCFRQNFAEGQQWSYDLEAMAKWYASYRRTMDYWREVLPEGLMIEVDYEATVADIETQSDRMLSHIGLDWSDRVLTFHENATLVRTASLAQVRQPLYKSAVGGWRKYADQMRPLIRMLRAEGVELPEDVD